MKPSRRSCLITGPFPVAAAILGLLFLPCAQAQNNANPPVAPRPETSSQKPSPQQLTVITNESINLSAVPHSSRATTPSTQPVSLMEKTPPVPVEDGAKKASEIVALRKEIKDKQKHIELLMHLFATDERRFLQSPSDPNADPAAQARIHSEQEELRAESAACGRLQARLDALASSPSQH